MDIRVAQHGNAALFGLARVGTVLPISLLALCAGLGLAHTCSDLYAFRQMVSEQIGTATWILLGAFALLPLLCAWWAARRERPIPPPVFIALLIIASLALRAILIATVEPMWGTDYLRYWERAMAMAASEEFSVSSLYHQRALLVPYPVELLFGPEAVTALKWANALLLLAVQLFTYDMLRLTLGHRVAQAASILLLASPLPAYAALIPSHDVWALPFLVGLVWAATRAAYLPLAPLRRVLGVLGLGGMAAVMAYCLELQRSTGMLAAASLLASGLIYVLRTRTHGLCGSENRTPVALISVAALTLALQPAISEIGGRIGIEPATSNTIAVSKAMKFAAHGSAMGTGRSAWYARFNDRFRAKSLNGLEEANDFARSVVLSTWAVQPSGKLDAMQAHAQRLFSLSYPPDWDTLLRRPEGMDPEVRNLLVAHLSLFGALLLTLTLASWVRFIGRPDRLPFPALSSAVFVLGLALVLLVVFENKPFNISAVWWLYPVVIASAMGRFPKSQETADTGLQRAWLVACALMVPVVAVLAWSMFEAGYRPSHGRILSGWEVRAENSTDARNADIQAPAKAFEPSFFVQDRRSFVLRDAPEDGARIQKRANRLYLPLRFPTAPVHEGDRVTAGRTLCLSGSRRNLEFFMFAPYQRRDVHRAFSLEVVIDGSVVASLPIPHEDRSDSMKLVSVPMPVEGEACVDLAFSLHSHVNRAADSWARASYVEVWFPRLAF